MHDLSAPASYIAPLVVWMLLNREETSSSVLVWFFYVLQQSIGVFSDRILPSGTWWEVVDKEKEVELKDHSVNSSIKRATQRIKWYYSSCLFWFSVAVIEHSEQKPLRGNRVYFRSHFLVTSITEEVQARFKQEQWQEQWKKATYWLVTGSHSTCFLKQPRAHLPRMVLSTVGEVFQHQSTLRTILCRHDHSPFVLSYASTETPPHTVGYNFSPVISQLCSSSTAILGFFSYLCSCDTVPFVTQRSF